MYFKALQSFYRAFIPPAGIARARCPPEFAYVFRAFIAERYRGGDRSAGRPAIWLRPIPALEWMAIFANFLFASSDIILTIIMLRAIRRKPWPLKRVPPSLPGAGGASVGQFVHYRTRALCPPRSAESRSVEYLNGTLAVGAAMAPVSIIFAPENCGAVAQTP